MENKKKVSFSMKVLILYLCIAGYCLVFFLVGGEDVFLKRVHTETINEVDNVGELLDGDSVEETFISNALQLTSIKLKIGTYDRQNTGFLNVQILDDSQELGSVQVSTASLVNGNNTIEFDKPIAVEQNSQYKLKVTSEGGTSGNAVTVYYGTSSSNCVQLVSKNKILSNQELICVIYGKIHDPLGIILAYGTIIFLVGLGVYLLHMIRSEKKGKRTIGMDVLNAYHRYSFLMQQLVSREFKVRYKRSVLGILWSFVNPMLTMLVQFFVFTLIFKSSIPNYIVYLLIGITFFNFYSEATNGGLLSIITNATLIKKVYVPKYIYPLSQVFSASINFGISLILMFGVSFICGIYPNKFMLLIPFAIISSFVLNIGVSFLLATGMTFFRDVQFMYSVFMTALTYATPMFWDMSMIPDKYTWIFKINPLADIIIFMRNIILNNIYPGTDLVYLMIGIPLIFLIIGVWVFRKNQDNFILYI